MFLAPKLRLVDKVFLLKRKDEKRNCEEIVKELLTKLRHWLDKQNDGIKL